MCSCNINTLQAVNAERIAGTQMSSVMSAQALGGKSCVRIRAQKINFNSCSRMSLTRVNESSISLSQPPSSIVELKTKHFSLSSHLAKPFNVV